jgi:hypothetical protein
LRFKLPLTNKFLRPNAQPQVRLSPLPTAFYCLYIYTSISIAPHTMSYKKFPASTCLSRTVVLHI